MLATRATAITTGHGSIEEAVQAITVDILAHKLARESLDSRTVRRYIRAAYGLRDPLRFRSLDAPVSHNDGRTLGESLAA